MMTKKVKSIISQIINNCQFPKIEKLNKGEKDSFYKKFPFFNGHIVEVRVSNHKTDLNTWATRKYEDGMPDVRFSIVFQDSDSENIVYLHNPTKRPINVIEFVYDMRDENTTLSDREVGAISKQIMGLPNALSFDDPTPFCASGTSLSGVFNTDNNQQIKENKMKKKQTIRLNESQLHRVIKESVKQVLNELDWKTYANAQHAALQRSKGDRPLSKAKLRKQEKSPYEAWNDITYADRKFRDAKVKAFNDTHKGAKMVKRSDQGPNPTDYDYLETPVGPFYGNGYDNQDNNDTRYKHKPDFLYTGADKSASEDTLNDTQEFSDYLQGNYTNDDEKGWHFKNKN